MSTEPDTSETVEAEQPRGLIGRARAGIKWLNANKKRFFWWWVGYQAIKGVITLSLIWIPLLLLWLRSRGEA
jgi:hypothetical protein